MEKMLSASGTLNIEKAMKVGRTSDERSTLEMYSMRFAHWMCNEREGSTKEEDHNILEES